MKLKYFSPAIFFFCFSLNAQDSGSPIGYETVEEAFNALQANPDAVVTEYEGWTIFNLKNNGIYTLWSFTPDQHPAHPAVVRRIIAKQAGELLIDMDAICFAGMFECDELIEQFRLINERLRNQS